MSYTITNASESDLQEIYRLFEQAITFQKKNNYIGWASYDKAFVQSDIQHQLLYKIIKDDTIACIFSICFTDALIWREKENHDAVYLHRIILNQAFKGEKIFQKVLDWAIHFANGRKLKYIRMDTWAENEKIISYYKSYGFSFIENYTTPGTDDLPIQHRNLNVALLEFDLNAGAAYPALDKVNISHQLSLIDQFWTQKVIGQSNGQLVKLAKGIGEINWHKHDDQDELFILYKGHLTIQLRNKDIELYPNEMFIVPKGVEHCPVSHGESSFLIMGLNITSNKAGGRPS
jgi:mannose-6-phosphate isomerase-like protein (cupin superfamily)